MRLRSIRRSFLVLGLLVAAAGSLAAQSTPLRMVGYYRTSDRNAAPPYPPSQIPYAKLTHIIHFCIWPAPAGDGSLLVPDNFRDPELISRAHAAGVKVLLAVGSGGALTLAMREIAADPEARSAFAQNIAAFVAANGYDGVDIDWEVPLAPDYATAPLLFQALRQHLPSPYVISLASSANPGRYGIYDFGAITPYVDFYNVLTYDFHGPWMSHAGHNAPLALSPLDPGPEGSLETTVHLYDLRGVPREMLNIGMPFYGYQFNSASRLWESCRQQNCRATELVNYGAYIKPRINAMGWQSNYDTMAEAPYLLRSDGTPGLITYDDPAAMKLKVDTMVGGYGIPGVTIWELSQDYDGKSQDLLDALYQAMVPYGFKRGAKSANGIAVQARHF